MRPTSEMEILSKLGTLSVLTFWSRDSSWLTSDLMDPSSQIMIYKAILNLS